MPEPLTKLERRILDYLIEYLRRNTYQPSIREIGRRFNIKSTKTVSEHLQSLAYKGWIERDPSRSRGVRLLGLNMNPHTVSVPCYQAGDGAGFPGAIGATFELDRALAGEGGAYFVPMIGDSMERAGLKDGDLLLIEPVPDEELEDGDIVLARHEGEATVKRYVRRGAGLVLEPADPAGTAIHVEYREDCEIAGRVSAIFRHLRARPIRVPSGTGDAESSGAIP